MCPKGLQIKKSIFILSPYSNTLHASPTTIMEEVLTLPPPLHTFSTTITPPLPPPPVHSSQQIEETKQEMKSMTGHLTNTRKLMSKYGRRETTDKMLIGAAFFFFACCALNIIKNRIFPNLF